MQKLTSGMELVHKGRFHANTESEGFCFLSEKTKAESLHDENEYTFDPTECYNFLSGIVSSDVLVEFHVNEDVSFKESYGIYERHKRVPKLNKKCSTFLFSGGVNFVQLEELPV